MSDPRPAPWTASLSPLDVARTYFQEIDSGRFPAELFAPDLEFYFPKYGVGRGLDELRECAAGLSAAGVKLIHHRDRLKYLLSDRHVIVEGTTEGVDGDRTWHGGETPGGRFCSVFGITAEGLIGRMYVYLDPDYTSLDKDRFRWKRACPRW